VTDGAAAVVLMRRSKAKELGVEILAKYVTTAVAGKFSSYHLTKQD
jgi:acetyl-CoA acyltransferase 1